MNRFRPQAVPTVGWHYDRFALVLHWISAVLLVFMTGLGWYMMEIEHTPGAQPYFVLHKSLGLIVLALVLMRLGWRRSHPVPQLPTQMPAWQLRAAQLVQVGLYLCMLALPLAGIAGAIHSKSGLVFFGYSLPRLAAANHDMAETYYDIHGALVWLLVALVCTHVAGALKHRFIDRDGVFERMVPGRD